MSDRKKWTIPYGLRANSHLLISSFTKAFATQGYRLVELPGGRVEYKILDSELDCAGYMFQDSESPNITNIVVNPMRPSGEKLAAFLDTHANKKKKISLDSIIAVRSSTK